MIPLRAVSARCWTAKGAYTMTIEVHPLHEALGAEVRGVDLSRDIAPEDFKAIHRAHLDHGILLFRDQDLTP